MPDAFFFDLPTRHLIVALAARNSVPTVYFSRLFVEAGGLIAYSADFSEELRQAAGSAAAAELCIAQARAAACCRSRKDRRCSSA
jgi:hypothetical protein